MCVAPSETGTSAGAAVSLNLSQTESIELLSLKIRFYGLTFTSSLSNGEVQCRRDGDDGEQEFQPEWKEVFS